MRPDSEPGSAGPAQPGGPTVTTHLREGVLVLGPARDLDHNSAQVLRRALDTADPAPRRIIRDLHQLTFMDSSGINCFLTAYQQLTPAGGWLRLAAAPETVTRTLTLVGLDQIIPLHATVDQALAP